MFVVLDKRFCNFHSGKVCKLDMIDVGIASRPFDLLTQVNFSRARSLHPFNFLINFVLETARNEIVGGEKCALQLQDEVMSQCVRVEKLI